MADVFFLEREAVNGDALAQHELGVRYLLGRDLPADTVRSAEWLRRSAEQHFAPACYNYGLLLANGWGVEWNPFEAFRYFRRAAGQGMPEAQHVVGIFYTDNLVVALDWRRAHYWMSMAAEQGLEAAVRARDEIVRRGLVAPVTDTLREEPAPAPVPRGDDAEDWVPAMLDFTHDSPRTGADAQDLANELLASFASTAADSSAIAGLFTEESNREFAIRRIEQLVEACNPEAMLLLGSLYEEGRLLPRDPLRAAVLYLRASWMELPSALRLLARLLASADIRDRLYTAAYASNTDAQYVLAALRALDLDRRLSPAQARDMLQRAIEAGSTDALVQLGIWYAGGRLIEQDTERAVRCWEDAARAGSREGAIRYAATVLARGDTKQRANAIVLLDSAALSGCLVANVMVARSYETGLGRSPRAGVAARLYRDAAIRGSRIAYGALRAMYERLRPEDEVFRTPAR
jgi:TPR repeat protein